MRALIIDDNFKSEMARLLAAPKIDAAKIASNVIAGDDPAYVAYLPVGIRVVYTEEECPLKTGAGTVWVKHLSVSVNGGPGDLPSPFVVDTIASELGFPPFEECFVRVDKENQPPRFVEMVAEVSKCPAPGTRGISSSLLKVAKQVEDDKGN